MVCVAAAASLVSVAVHPLGFSVAVGSKESLVVHNLLIQSLAEFKSFGAKQIRAVRYSNAGGMLAASVGLLINVYHSVSSQLLHSFPGVWCDVMRLCLCVVFVFVSVLCCILLRYVVLCRVVSSVVSCCVVLCRVVSCCVVLCCYGAVVILV
jgi:hypothetical protein